MRRPFVARIGGGFERRGEAFAQCRELGFEHALAFLLVREFVAERLQRQLDVGDPDFEFGQ